MENPATIFFFAAMVNRFVESPVIPLEKVARLWNYDNEEGNRVRIRSGPFSVLEAIITQGGCACRKLKPY